MKRTVLKLGFILLIGVMVISNCKKGENDPFIALKSRDGRITGTWELSSQETKTTKVIVSDGDITTNITTQIFDGNFMITATPFGTTTIQFFLEIVIEKDGTFSRKVITDGDKTETTGHWWWLADKKSKTRIAFDDDSESYEIDRLKNKELILMQESFIKETNTDGDYNQTTITTTLNFSKQK